MTLARRLFSGVGALVFTAMLAGACSGGDVVTQSERVGEPTAIPAPSSTDDQGRELTLAVVDGGPRTGQIITDHRGFAVYGVSGEQTDNLICVDDCISVWVPVVPRDDAVASDLDPERFDSFERPDGTSQATYLGVPLYTWTGDSEIGITGGAGVAGTWFALTESGGFFDAEPE